MNLYFNGPRSAFRMDLTLGSDGNSLWAAEKDPIIASQESGFDVSPRLRKVNFGEYEQRAMDGINAIPMVTDFTFRNMDLKYAEALEKFFRGGSGPYDRDPSEFFYFKPYQFTHLEYLKYVVENWRVTYTRGAKVTMKAAFRQVSDFGESFDYS